MVDRLAAGTERSVSRVGVLTGPTEMMAHLEQAYQFDIHIRRDVDRNFPHKE